MMNPKGKGFYVWKISQCEGGDIARIIDRAKRGNIGHLLIKISDGLYEYNVVNGRDLAKELTQACKNAGIEPWGWSYTYGHSPITEARLAARRANELDVAGFIINAEHEYKKSGMASTAKTYGNELRLHLGGRPIGLSSYRYPNLHPQFPWAAWVPYIDFWMPQVYWEQATNSAHQLASSLAQYRAFSAMPFVPTGSAYTWNGWTATSAEIQAFFDQAKALGLSAVNFWEWWRADQTGLWETIGGLEWGAPPSKPEPAKTFVARVLSAALNFRREPRKANNIIRTVEGGKEFEVLESRTVGKDTWHKVRVVTVEEGWIAGHNQGKDYSILVEK